MSDEIWFGAYRMDKLQKKIPFFPSMYVLLVELIMEYRGQRDIKYCVSIGMVQHIHTHLTVPPFD